MLPRIKKQPFSDKKFSDKITDDGLINRNNDLFAGKKIKRRL